MLELSAVQCASSSALCSEQTVSIQLMAGTQLILHADSEPVRMRWLRMLAGRCPPASGHYALDGEDLYSGTDRQRAARRNMRIGLIDVSHPLLPHLTLQDNIALPARYRSGTSHSQANAEARQILDVVGLGKLCPADVQNLSEAQGALALLARALINTPDAIILYEPALLREDVQQIVRRTLEMSEFRAICIVSLLSTPISWRSTGLQYDLMASPDRDDARV